MRRFSMTVPMVAFEVSTSGETPDHGRHFGDGAQLEREVDAHGLLHLQLERRARRS